MIVTADGAFCSAPSAIAVVMKFDILVRVK